MKRILGIVFFLLFTTLCSFGDELRFVQVDGLFYAAGNPDSEAVLKHLVSSINQQKDISFVVFSGNNISKPTKENLTGFLKAAKKLKMPFYVIPGNKDVNRRKDMSKEEYAKTVRKYSWAHKKIKTVNYVFEKQGVIFIVSDGSKDVIPTSSGYYKKETLDWVEEQINLYSDKNIIILQHFPLVPPSEREAYYTFKADEYLKLLSSHKNVKAVISGHFNVSKEQTVDGLLHISTQNAPKYRVIDVMDCDGKNPVFWSVIRE